MTIPAFPNQQTRAISHARDVKRRLFVRGHPSSELEILSPPALRRKRIIEAEQRRREIAVVIPLIPVIPATPIVPTIHRDEPELEPARPLLHIMKEVALAHGFTVNDIRSGARNARVVKARHEFFYRAAVETLATYVKIGRVCGDRDHSTIMHGIRRHCHRNGIEPCPRGLAPLIERPSTAGMRPYPGPSACADGT